MPNTINLGSINYIRQYHKDFCLPAAIVNVLKYYGEDVNQYEIAGMWVHSHPFQDINIPQIIPILNTRFGQNYDFELGGNTSINNRNVTHNNKTSLVTYAKGCCDDGNPLIIVKGFFDNNGNPTPGAHILVVIGYENNIIHVFDPGNICVFPINICYIPQNFLINQNFLHNNLTTLLIKPKPPNNNE